MASVEFNLGTSTDFRVPDLGLHRGKPSGVWFPTVAIVAGVRSPNDESYDKFGFYFDHGVEEILIADLSARSVEWFIRGTTGFEPSDTSALLGVTGLDVAETLGW